MREIKLFSVLLLLLLVACGKGETPNVPEDEGIQAIPGTYFITKSDVAINGSSSTLGPKEATIGIKEDGGYVSLELAYSFSYLKAYADENEDKDILLKIGKLPFQREDGNYRFSSSDCSDVAFFQAHEEAELSEVSVTGTFGKDVDLTISGLYRGFQYVDFHIRACSKESSDQTPRPYYIDIEWLASGIFYLHNETGDPIGVNVIWKEGLPSAPTQEVVSVLPGEEKIVFASSFLLLDECLEAWELVFPNGERKRYPFVLESNPCFEGLGDPETLPDYLLHGYPHCVDRHATPAYHYRIRPE